MLNKTFQSVCAVILIGAVSGCQTSSDSGDSSGGTTLYSCSSSDSDRTLSISSATDDGNYEGTHSPALAIDGSLEDDSRWSSESASGDDKWLLLDLGSEQTVAEVAIAFYNGEERIYDFYIETSTDGVVYQSVYELGESGGTSSSLETFDVTDTAARYVRITGEGNSENDWNSYLEVEIYSEASEVDDSCAAEPLEVADLDPDATPSENFELIDWYLSIPTDTDSSGTSDSIKENELSSGYENSEYFYTADDGGLVFRCPVDGFKTSTNTSYVRVELREMLRRGDTSISTQGVNENNWVFSSTTSSAQDAAGGVDGLLRATLAVNEVTTTGEDYQVGRIIIGQIHANDDEPVRLYYRKLPDNENGSIYIAHEILDGDDEWYELIGSRDNDASNPSDGIALDEVFSYQILVVGDTLEVTIMRDDKDNVVQTVDMSSSGYDDPEQYQYFKLGLYNQNNSGDPDDYAQVTFYAFENTHSGYDY